MPRIRVSAVVLHRADGAVLLVRKRGTSVFMNPGGKPEPGESPLQCAVREVAEELALELEPSRMAFLGDLTAPAANEADHAVDAWVFRYTDPVPDSVDPASEIDTVAWLDPTVPPAFPVAPLFTDAILPALVAAGWSARG